MEMVQVTPLKKTFFPNLNVLVAVSKGMWAVKFCSNKILQFLTGSAGYAAFSCITAIKRC